MKRNTCLLLAIFTVLCLAMLLVHPVRTANAPLSKENAFVPAETSAQPPVAPQDPKKHRDLTAAGQPNVMNSQSSLSTAVFTAFGGRGTQFSEISLLANWDGREDFVADRAQKIDDFSFTEVEIDVALTRTGISEHTYANGHIENVYYYGDSLGNFWVGTDLNPGINPTSVSSIDTLRQVNIPTLVNSLTSGGFTLLNPQAGDCTDDQVTVTGIAVNPVADLGDFGLCDTIGEVVYVSILDTAGCSSNAANQPFRTRILAFAFTDVAGGVAPAGAIQILRNSLGNNGIAIDDDGSLYFHLVDAVQFSSAAIFKVTEGPRTVAGCAVNPRANRVVSSIPSGLTGGISLTTAATTALVAGGMRLTNYSGAAATFGNVVALASGANNVLYAALSRSFVSTDDPFTQSAEGRFSNPAALGPTPSMIISFADRIGLTDICSSPAAGQPGSLKIADGFADAAIGTARIAGVNNFRVFALGLQPTIGMSAGEAIGLTPSTLKLDMQIDPGINAGLMVDEDRTVFVISGGAPAGAGRDPSPLLGEILAFPDRTPYDRRADFIDLRGNAFPNPPASGGNVGDGDSDRFDHIFHQAPVDAVTGAPTGLSGLARGFLLYTNRTRNRNDGTLANLPNGGTQADDASSGVLVFDDFDDGHQVAGGDDQNTPFRGDDNDGVGNPVLVGALLGGFEFTFGGPVGVSSCTWNGFFLNSNGNITFGAGDTDNTPTVPEFRANLPKIAPAWADFNPAARATNPINFPVQALGFAGVNAFKVRWINVAEFGFEGCTTNASNTFSVTLYDDGTARDENENQALNPANPIGNNSVPFDEQEGPTDLRFVREPNTQVLVGEPPRGDGTGNFINDYARMDLLGTAARPVISGYSIGGLSPLNPPGLCETDLGLAATVADDNLFGVIQSQTSNIWPSLIGEGTEPTIFEIFATGLDAAIGPGGEINFAQPDFDLRFEGNDPAVSKSDFQTDTDNGEIGFYGVACGPPPNPLVQQIVFGPFVTTPTTTGVINVIEGVEVNLLGFGFFPNETTTVCFGDPGGGGALEVPTVRPGKTVSTAVTVAIDTNGDAIPEAIVSLTQVTPINRNLVRARLAPLAAAPGTPFPFAAGGGVGTATVTTTFTAGDNNVFGPFTRTAVGSFAAGVRAPVVLSVTASEGNCGIPQNVLISGASFVLPAGSVTGVFAVDRDNQNNVLQANTFNVLNNNLIEATFNFGAANAGRTFLIFVTGPGGTSRNLTALPVGAPPTAPLGNEQGITVTFSCQGAVAETLSLGAVNVDASEGCATANVTVNRLNPTGGTVTVDYATSDGSAVQKSDYGITRGTLTFGPGETTKVIAIPINEDSFVEGNQTFNLALSNATGGAVAGAPGTVTIIDDDVSAPTSNPIDEASNFVCQQYHDFLNRQPDPAGLAFWTNEITSCGSDAACIEVKRQNVSAAFFLSIEFQETGFGAIRMQRVAFGRKSDTAALRLPYAQFMRDAQQIGNGVMVGQPGADALLEQNKQAYATQIVNSAEFMALYGPGLTAAQYVDALFASAMVVPTTAERDAAIAAFGGGGTAGRVAALRSAADSNSVRQAEFNAAFVLMQYYGYLRRNPTDPPDGNDAGYQFWLTKLNSFGGNFIQAELVKAFITSIEYRERFGP